VWDLKGTRNLDVELLNTALNNDSYPFLKEMVREVITVTTYMWGKVKACNCEGLLHVTPEKDSISKFEKRGVGSAILDKSLVIKVNNG